jgi:hypothetical protein
MPLSSINTATTPNASQRISQAVCKVMDQLQKTYRYDALPYGNIVRSLILEPGAEQQPLQCNLRMSLLGSAKFEAICYVWGRALADAVIICNGRPSFLSELRCHETGVACQRRRTRSSSLHIAITLHCHQSCAEKEVDDLEEISRILTKGRLGAALSLTYAFVYRL